MAISYSIFQNQTLDLGLYNQQDTLIDDIKQGHGEEVQQSDYRQQIIDGLKDTSNPSVPSVLLWDDVGLKLFSALTLTPGYAPFHSEVAILNQNADEIVQIVPSGTLLVELGCGSLHKTSIILSAFERQQREVTYYALDISRQELVEGLGKLTDLFGQSKYVKLRGLLGSYEDGIGWLSQYATSKVVSKMVTFLWVGNSIANFSRADAGALLEGFFTACHGLGMACQFIVGVHACQDETQLAISYNSSDPVLCNFILHGLENVNLHLGQEVFRPGEWVCSCKFDRADRTLRVYYEAVQGVSIAFVGIFRGYGSSCPNNKATALVIRNRG